MFSDDGFADRLKLLECWSFVQRHSFLLSSWPALCIQQALNEPPETFAHTWAQGLMGKGGVRVVEWLNNDYEEKLRGLRWEGCLSGGYENCAEVFPKSTFCWVFWFNMCLRSMVLCVSLQEACVDLLLSSDLFGFELRWSSDGGWHQSGNTAFLQHKDRTGMNVFSSRNVPWSCYSF